eukprot:Hpha_TRINITY_DN15627_c2_g1::TRINITY_DN15627_c2_g1_i1::g.98612::m.98612
MGDEAPPPPADAPVDPPPPAGTPPPDDKASELSKKGSARGSASGAALAASGADDDKKDKRLSVPPLGATLRSNVGKEGDKAVDQGLSALGLQRKGSGAAATRQPSTRPPPTEGGRSRKGSQIGSAPGQLPQSPLVPQGSVLSPAARQPSVTDQLAASNFEGVQPPGEGGSQLGRSGSKQSLGVSQRRASEAQGASRQGSFAQQPSRQGSRASLRQSMSGERELLVDEPQMDPLAAPAAAEPEPEADEFEGVDFRMNWKLAREEAEKYKEIVASKNKEIAAANEKVAELTREVDELHHHQAELVRQGSSGDHNAALTAQLRQKDQKIKDLEGKLKRKGSDAHMHKSLSEDPSKDREISNLRDRLDRAERENERLNASAREAAEVRSAALQLQGQVQERDLDIQQKAIAIQQLQQKLEQAQEAIVSATDYGWENDIKLAQARRALMSILDQHSPERVGRILAGEDGKVGASRGPSPEVQRLSEIEREVQKLNARKAAAVEAEDYGLAGEVQARLQQLRAEAASLEPRSMAISPPGDSCGGHYVRTRGAAG